MGKHNITLKSLNVKNEGKDSYFISQEKAFYQYLLNNIATATMVCNATGITQKNITRYKRNLERHGKLWQVEKKPCIITGFKAWYLTTNPELAPKEPKQLSLF